MAPQGTGGEILPVVRAEPPAALVSRRLGLGAAVTLLGLHALAVPAADAAASPPRTQLDARCAAGWKSRQGLTIATPGPRWTTRITPGRDVPSLVAAPWPTPLPGTLAGTAVLRTASGARWLVVCTQTRRGRLRAYGAPARLARGAVLSQAAVAAPYVAWATRPADRSRRFTIRWRRLGSRTTAVRQGRGTLDALVPTAGGEVVASSVRSGRQRIVLHRRRHADRPLLPAAQAAQLLPRRVARGGPLGVWLWEPRTIAIAPNSDDVPDSPSLGSDQPAAVIELPAGTSPCRTAFRPTFRAHNSRLAVQFTSTDRWVRSAGISPKDFEAPDVRQHLRICNRSGQLLVAATVGVDSEGDGDSEQLSDPDVVGNVVLGLVTGRSGGDSGAGSSGSRYPVVYGPPEEDTDDEARTTPTRLVRHPVLTAVATRSGAAWVTQSRAAVDGPLVLWTSDATGIRRRVLSAPVIAPDLPAPYVSPSGVHVQVPAQPRRTDVVLRLTGASLRVLVGFVDGFDARFTLSQVVFDERLELTPVPPEATTIAPGVGASSSATCPAERWAGDCSSALTLPDR